MNFAVVPECLKIAYPPCRTMPFPTSSEISPETKAMSMNSKCIHIYIKLIIFNLETNTRDLDECSTRQDNVLVFI